MKSCCTILGIYLIGCLLAYPCAKWMVVDADVRSYPSLYKEHVYSKEQKEWALGLSIFSWVIPPVAGMCWIVDKIDDSISFQPSW